MKKIITISLLIILICVISIGFIGCNDDTLMLTDFRPWLNEIKAEDIVEISTEYEPGGVAPGTSTNIYFTSDREEIERLLTAWRNVALAEGGGEYFIPGTYSLKHCFYMKDGTKHIFFTYRGSERKNIYSTKDFVKYVMSDCPEIAQDKVTRVETGRA